MAQTAKKANNGVERRERTALRAVPKKARGGSRLGAVFPAFVVTVVFLTVVLLANSVSKALIAQGSVELNRTKNAYLETKAVNESLKIEQAKMLAPQRVEKVAIEKLKMIKPAIISYIKLEPPKGTSKESVAMADKE